jgi:hypothetical protein
MKKISLLFLLVCCHLKIFPQTPLILNIDIGNKIWLYGQVVIFNGWPPNIRMVVRENYIIGIDENTFPHDLKKHLPFGLPKGKFKLKLVRKTRLPYYEAELLVFKIVEYGNIEIINH